MTSVKTILKKYQGFLEPKELDALLALALKKNLLYIYKNPDKEISPAAAKAFAKLVKKRKQGWSLAYLQGYKEFLGLKFLVSKHTLVPRPESELLVEEALKYIKDNHKVLDIGTGSGCLILSLAKLAKKSAYYTALDISPQALKTARTNARKLGLKKQIKFIRSNLLQNLPQQKFDIIIANLPYLTPAQLKEPSIKKEPALALMGGADGLNAYRRLLAKISPYLEKKYLLLLEIDPRQKEKIELLVKQALPKAKIYFGQDLKGQIRIIKIQAV